MTVSDNLIAMFARTKNAQAFRRWVLNVIEQHQTALRSDIRANTTVITINLASIIAGFFI